MEKYYYIMQLLNGIIQHNKETENTLYYSIGEAEFHLSKWYEKGDVNAYIILPTYRKGKADADYL